MYKISIKTERQGFMHNGGLQQIELNGLAYIIEHADLRTCVDNVSIGISKILAITYASSFDEGCVHSSPLG